MKTTRRFFAALVLLAACGGGSTRDVEPDLLTLCAADSGVLVAWALKADECSARASGHYEAVLGMPTAAALETECRAKYKGYLEDGTVASPAPAAVAACQAYLAQVVCGATVDILEPGACSAVLEGTVGGGVYCEIDEQCRGDSFCNGGDGDSCGACKARVTGAAPCAADHECTSGACVNGACAALATAGGTCDSPADCIQQLECVGGQCAAGPATTGTACDADSGCAPLLSCIGGTCAKNEMSGTCPAY